MSSSPVRGAARAPRAVLVVLLLCATGCASRYYYEPSTGIDRTPADRGLDFEAVIIDGRDGARLSAWFVPAVGEAHATVVHFHGKSGNMGAHLRFVDWLPSVGFNVFLFDYRGFGESEGRPSPKRVHHDALDALDFVRSRPDVDADRLLVFGQSLGGAIAISALADGGSDGVRAVVTESALSSYRLVVRDQIAMMKGWSALKGPLSWLLTNNRYSPDRVIERLSPIPVLLIHGSDDDGIPLYHCERLFDRAREPKTMWVVDGGRHLDAFTKHGAEYRGRLVEFFLGALAGAQSGHRVKSVRLQ